MLSVLPLEPPQPHATIIAMQSPLRTIVFISRSST
jgi:hypothetical protein